MEEEQLVGWEGGSRKKLSKNPSHCVRAKAKNIYYYHIYIYLYFLKVMGECN